MYLTVSYHIKHFLNQIIINPGPKNILIIATPYLGRIKGKNMYAVRKAIFQFSAGSLTMDWQNKIISTALQRFKYNERNALRSFKSLSKFVDTQCR